MNLLPFSWTRSSLWHPLFLRIIWDSQFVWFPHHQDYPRQISDVSQWINMRIQITCWRAEIWRTEDSRQPFLLHYSSTHPTWALALVPHFQLHQSQWHWFCWYKDEVSLVCVQVKYSSRKGHIFYRVDETIVTSSKEIHTTKKSESCSSTSDSKYADPDSMTFRIWCESCWFKHSTYT